MKSSLRPTRLTIGLALCGLLACSHAEPVPDTEPDAGAPELDAGAATAAPADEGHKLEATPEAQPEKPAPEPEKPAKKGK